MILTCFYGKWFGYAHKQTRTFTSKYDSDLVVASGLTHGKKGDVAPSGSRCHYHILLSESLTIDESQTGCDLILGFLGFQGSVVRRWISFFNFQFNVVLKFY